MAGEVKYSNLKQKWNSDSQLYDSEVSIHAPVVCTSEKVYMWESRLKIIRDVTDKVENVLILSLMVLFGLSFVALRTAIDKYWN